MVTGFAVLLVLVLGGLYLQSNTNAFGSDALCGGSFRTAEARTVISGNGRLSSSGNGELCEVRQKGWFRDTDSSLSVFFDTESARFPLETGLWKVSGHSDIAVGGATTAWSNGHDASLLLPESCAAKVVSPGDRQGPSRPVLTLRTLDRQQDPRAVLDLLVTTARSFVTRTGCADAGAVALGSGRHRASDVSDTRFDRTCGQPGFSLPQGLRPTGTTVQEQTTGALESSWFCDLTTPDSRGTKDSVVRLAVIRDSGLAASLKSRNPDAAQCDGGKTYFAVDFDGYLWGDEHEGWAQDEAALRSWFISSAREALHCR